MGLTALAAGVGLLGYVGWQLYGTNYVSQARHDRTVEALVEEWDRSSGTGSVLGTDGGGESGYVEAIIRVPAFGEDYAVPVLQGVGDEALASGFGHFSDSAGPGGVGNFALAGHRITHGEPLRDMPALAVGDEIVVETQDRVYTYVLDTGGDDLRVPFTAGWVVGEQPVHPDGGPSPAPGEEHLITITTCAELFHTDDRLVAFGHLVDSRPR